MPYWLLSHIVLHDVLLGMSYWPYTVLVQLGIWDVSMGVTLYDGPTIYIQCLFYMLLRKCQMEVYGKKSYFIMSS